jgi:3-hydroxybutyryl-CoA dehydrogenase
MKLLVICNAMQKREFCTKPLSSDTTVAFITDPAAITGSADIIIDLLFENNPVRIAALAAFLPKPVIVNEVIFTLNEIGFPFIRINAWPGFLMRRIIEAAARPADIKNAQTIFKTLGWDCSLVPDTAGMISARILAMIINEAYFTFGEGIATKDAIDQAMKLGTNYPLGPFEWAAQIGIEKIISLLQQLNNIDQRYAVAPALMAANNDQ